MSRMYQESVYEGYLTKSPPKMNRKWQRRYFVLLPYQKLLYFSKYNGEQKGIIDLDQVQEVLLDVYICKAQSNIISVDVKGLGYESGKVGSGDRTYYLLADSREEMETWHKNICEVAGLQLCRKNNVVADYTQGEENYMSARRKTTIDREGEKRGLAYSFNPDSGQSSDYGTYTKDEFSQSAQARDYGLYASHGPAKELDTIAISLGEDSGSDDENFTRPDMSPASSKPPMKGPISVTPSRHSNLPKQQSVAAVSSLPIQPSLPICLDDDSPHVPPHRQEQPFPETQDFNLPVPPRRVSSQKRFSSPRYPAPSPEERPRPKERKSVTTRESRNVTQYSEVREVVRRPPSPQKRAAAKTPGIPISVLLTTVKDITPEPRAKPRRPNSSMSEESFEQPLSPVGITPYKTVMRGSEIFPEEEPIYANDPEDGAYVKFAPEQDLEVEGHYVTVSWNPLSVAKLADNTDAGGYAKIVEPKPRNKVSLTQDERLS